MAGIGTRVRHSMGRFEVPAAEAYRKAFIDLDDLAAQLAQHVQPRRILEVGCGDGALAQRLTETFPTASYLGVDPAETAGRLYAGRTEGVELRRATVGEVSTDEPFDLVVVVDVLHHIPVSIRSDVLREAGARVAPGGTIAIKDWTTDRPVFGRMAYWADRYVTGDKDVDFMSAADIHQLLAEALPDFAITASSTVRPWRENVLHLLAARA